MSDFDQDDEWSPPTEAEMKVIQARKERADKISKLMGDYLLKGYKMLSICCAHCDTILLQDKQCNNYCVACRELDADNVKDDPALSDQAAQRQAAEHTQRSAGTPSNSGPVQPAPDSRQPEGLDPVAATSSQAPSRMFHVTEAISGPSCQGAHHLDLPVSSPDLTRDVPRSSSSLPIQESPSVRPKLPFQPNASSSQAPTYNAESVTNSSLSILYKQLHSATKELELSTHVKQNIELCRLITSCAEAIAALHRLQRFD